MEEVKAKKRSVRLLSSPPELWTYTIVNEYPRDSEAYTQGLEFDKKIYESTGLKGNLPCEKWT